MKAEGPPFIKLEDLENLIQLRNALVEKGKYVLVRSFPGPTGSPIINVGILGSYKFKVNVLRLVAFQLLSYPIIILIRSQRIILRFSKL